MDLRQLRYFVGVVEAGSVSRAAVQLNVAQSAISQHVARLEAELKSQLLVRGQSGIKVTAAGQTLYNHARKILRHVATAKDDVRMTDNSPYGQVSVGFPHALSALLSYRLFEKVRETLPNVKLRLIDGVSSNLQELLQNDRLDIALLFVDAPERGLHVRPLVVEELLYICAGLNKKTVRLADVVARPLILPSRSSTVSKVVQAALGPKNLSFETLGEVDSMSALKQAASLGVAATILPWSALQGYEQSNKLDMARISDATLSRCISLCMPGGSDWSQAASAVADVLADVAQNLVKTNQWVGARLAPAATTLKTQTKSPRAKKPAD
jgi:LysR family nitrogen assimilation transcriptional regulator